MKWKYHTKKRYRRRRAALWILAMIGGIIVFFHKLNSGEWIVLVQNATDGRVTSVSDLFSEWIAPVQTTTDKHMPISVPLLSQERMDMPTGCELVSAFMLLEYYKCPMDFEEWVTECVPIQEFWHENGQLCNLSPAEAFIGLPWQNNGYGCYAPVICKAMQQALPSCTVVDVTGQPLEQLCADYINKGTPVLVWATMDMMKSGQGTVWQTPNGPFEWISNEHCLVLVGFDSSYYFFNDPAAGCLVKWEKALVEQRYDELGMQAVIVSAE